MATLWVAMVVGLTVAGSVALGIVAAYAGVIVLLRTFARSSPQPEPPRALVASENRAGGD